MSDESEQVEVHRRERRDDVDEDSVEDIALRRASAIAEFLDNRFVLPGTNIRFGFDPIIGLIPGIGDTLSAGIGAYIVYEAIRLRIGVWPITKMIFNLAVDWLVGLIPVVDIFADTAIRPNAKNAKLLKEALEKRKK